MSHQHDKATRPQPVRRRVLYPVAAFGAVTVVAGCASFGGNVKGDFLCQAPGGFCAPTSKIDEQALAAMNEGQPQATGALPGAAARARTGLIGASLSALVAGPASPDPGTRPAKALKVVLPARQDRFGRWRAPQIVYIEPDTSVAMAGYDPAAPQGRLSLADLAAQAPASTLFAALPAANDATGIKARVDAVLKAPAGRTGLAPGAGLAEIPADPGKPAAAPPASLSTAPDFPALDASGGR